MYNICKKCGLVSFVRDAWSKSLRQSSICPRTKNPARPPHRLGHRFSLCHFLLFFLSFFLNIFQSLSWHKRQNVELQLHLGELFHLDYKWLERLLKKIKFSWHRALSRMDFLSSSDRAASVCLQCWALRTGLIVSNSEAWFFQNSAFGCSNFHPLITQLAVLTSSYSRKWRAE